MLGLTAGLSEAKRKMREEAALADLNGKTLFITGASRGIGLVIALRAARDGANIAVAAKTDTPHPTHRDHHAAVANLLGGRPCCAACADPPARGT